MRPLALALALLPSLALAQGWPPKNGDTLPATCSTGWIFFVTTSSTTSLYECTATDTWEQITADVVGGAAAWGDITGTLSAQTDLQSALNGKSSTGHAHAFTEITGAVTDAQVPNTITVNLAAAATELESNGGNCAGNNFALGVDEFGAGECAQPAFSNLSGAATDAQVPDGITVTLAGTATALAADPSDCGTSTHFAVGVNASGTATCEAIADADVPNNITVDLATLATTATTANAGDTATAFFSAGTLEVSRGGTGAAPGADDQVLVSDSTSATTWRAIPDCDNGATSKVMYDTTTNTWSCGTDQTSGGGPTTLTSTTLQSDAVIATYTAITGLSFTPAANTNYLIDCFIRYTSTVATTGINFAWDVPASVNSIHMTGYTTTTATGANEGFSQRADNVGTSTANAVITVENVAYLEAQLRNGANATTTSLGFTPETANSVSVIAGSTCQYRVY